MIHTISICLNIILILSLIYLNIDFVGGNDELETIARTEKEIERLRSEIAVLSIDNELMNDQIKEYKEKFQ